MIHDTVPSETVGNKRVYVVQEHHHVLAAWSVIKQQHPEPLILLTLDHHTDTRPAFISFLYQTGRLSDIPSPESVIAACDSEANKISVHDLATVFEAINKLKNDQHIDAAIRAQIFDRAYVVQYADTDRIVRKTGPNIDEVVAFVRSKGAEWERDFESCPFRPYDMPESRMIVLPAECAIACDSAVHGNQCRVMHSAHAIESRYLQRKLDMADEISICVGVASPLKEKFVLDIDLDYFHSAAAIEPKDPSLFYELIRRAVAITVATEPRFVEAERLPGESIDADSLLEKLFQHILNAQTLTSKRTDSELTRLDR